MDISTELLAGIQHHAEGDDRNNRQGDTIRDHKI
jgi:hypothetical protein